MRCAALFFLYCRFPVLGTVVWACKEVDTHHKALRVAHRVKILKVKHFLHFDDIFYCSISLTDPFAPKGERGPPGIVIGGVSWKHCQ